MLTHIVKQRKRIAIFNTNSMPKWTYCTKPQLFPHYYKPNHLPRIEALGRVYAYLPREKGWVSNYTTENSRLGFSPYLRLMTPLFSIHTVSYYYFHYIQFMGLIILM